MIRSFLWEAITPPEGGFKSIRVNFSDSQHITFPVAGSLADGAWSLAAMLRMTAESLERTYADQKPPFLDEAIEAARREATKP